MDESDWLRRLAAYGLPGASPLGRADQRTADLLYDASTHKLLGVLAAAIREGAFSAGPDDLDQITMAHESAMREVLLLEEVLLEAVSILNEAGVDYRVLKGAAVAHLAHPDPSERCFGDNDLLVEADQMDQAIAALMSAGAIRPMPPLSVAFDRRFAKSVTLRFTGPTELDVHRTLAAGPYGFLVDLGDLARGPVEISLAGQPVLTLSRQRHLIHGAIHVALGDVTPRLGNVRDLALLARHDDVDADSLVATVTQWGCAAPVAVGLRAAAALDHNLTDVEQWAVSYEISDVDRRRLDSYSQRLDRFRRQAMASWPLLSWRERFGFARALVVPSAANRAARGRSRRIQLRRVRRD